MRNISTRSLLSLPPAQLRTLRQIQWKLERWEVLYLLFRTAVWQNSLCLSVSLSLCLSLSIKPLQLLISIQAVLAKLSSAKPRRSWLTSLGGGKREGGREGGELGREIRNCKGDSWVVDKTEREKTSQPGSDQQYHQSVLKTRNILILRAITLHWQLLQFYRKTVCAQTPPLDWLWCSRSSSIQVMIFPIESCGGLTAT